MSIAPVTLTGLMLLVAALAAAVAPRAVAPALPAPTGPFRVGTSRWHVIDASRRERFAPDRVREVEVVAFYPANVNGLPPAPYLREGPVEARTFAAALRAQRDVFDALGDVVTHAAVEASVREGTRLPVLIFSHGYTAPASAYATLLEDLASRGYAVISIVHPYEAAAATLSTGEVVTMLDETNAFRAGIQSVFAEWAKEDEVARAITSATDPTVQDQTLRDYLAGLKHTTVVLNDWVADTSAVVADLGTRSSRAPSWLTARLDLSRFGIFGHSMGGVTSAAWCATDRRCAAAANLDGSPQYGTLVDGRTGRPMLMVYSARDGRVGVNDPVYRRAASRYVTALVDGTKHLEFSDLPLWGGVLRERGALGTIAPERAVALTRTVVAAFFDQEMLGKKSPLLNGHASEPDLHVTAKR